MLSQIKPKIKELLDEHPSLKDKKEIRVAMMLGSAHASFFDLLQSQGFEATRTISRPHLAFPSLFLLELYKRCVFGEPITDELMARAVLERGFKKAFGESLRRLSRDTQKADGSIAKIVSQFNFEEIKGMFETVSRFEEFPAIFVSKIIEKGFKIPQSEKEMDDLLARPLPPRPNSPEPKP